MVEFQRQIQEDISYLHFVIKIAQWSEARNIFLYSSFIFDTGIKLFETTTTIVVVVILHSAAKESGEYVKLYL